MERTQDKELELEEEYENRGWVDRTIAKYEDNEVLQDSKRMFQSKGFWTRVRILDGVAQLQVWCPDRVRDMNPKPYSAYIQIKTGMLI